MGKKQDKKSLVIKTDPPKPTIADSKEVIEDFFSIKKKLEDMINKVKIKKEGQY